MNEPIINPFYIYLADIAPSLCFVTGCLGFALLFICAMNILNAIIDGSKSQVSIKVFYIGVLLVAFSVLMPSKQGIYLLIFNSCITPANIQTSTESIETLFDSIEKRIEKVK